MYQEKPHEAARKIDPDRHFPPPESHPRVEMTPEIDRAIRNIITYYGPVEIEVPFLKLPEDVRWYTYQFIPTGDLARFIVTSNTLRDELASYSRKLNAHCTYTVEGARELSDDDDQKVPGDKIDADFETLLLLHNEYVVKVLEPELVEALITSCDYVDDDTLRYAIRSCLDTAEEDKNIQRAEVNDEHTWEILKSYVLKLKRERRLEAVGAAVPLPDDPDETLRLLAVGLVRRT